MTKPQKKINKENREAEVYLSGKVVRQLLERFKDSRAIGLIDVKVKAFVPFATKEKERERIVEEIDNFRCSECGGICFDKEDALKIVQNLSCQTKKHQLCYNENN